MGQSLGRNKQQSTIQLQTWFTSAACNSLRIDWHAGAVLFSLSDSFNERRFSLNDLVLFNGMIIGVHDQPLGRGYVHITGSQIKEVGRGTPPAIDANRIDVHIGSPC